MNIEVKKREGESIGAFLFRFNKKIKRSGILREVKRRRFRARPLNRRQRLTSALYRERKGKELERLKRYGYVAEGKTSS